MHQVTKSCNLEQSENPVRNSCHAEFTVMLVKVLQCTDKNTKSCGVHITHVRQINCDVMTAGLSDGIQNFLKVRCGIQIKFPIQHEQVLVFFCSRLDVYLIYDAMLIFLY